jgi:PIN domain
VSAAAVRVGLLYDSGALIAAENDKPQIWVLHRQALAQRRRIIVPVPVLAQVWRGSARQVSLARLLRGCDIVEMTEPIGRAAGVLCGRAGTSDIVDATAVVMAIEGTAAIVTSDIDVLTVLIDAAQSPIRPALKAV